MLSTAEIRQWLEAAREEAWKQEEAMLWEVAEAEEAEQQAEEERKQWEEEERQRAEEERWRAEEKRRAEEKAEEEWKWVEAEWEEAQQLRDNLESFEKGLGAMSAEETAELAERAWKVRLGEGSSEQGLCWHCRSWKTACIRK